MLIKIKLISKENGILAFEGEAENASHALFKHDCHIGLTSSMGSLVKASESFLAYDQNDNPLLFDLELLAEFDGAF